MAPSSLPFMRAVLLATSLLFGSLLAVVSCSSTGAPTISEFAISTFDSQPFAITAGHDGKSLYFTEPGANNIGRITTAGVITEYAVPTANSKPAGITTGPDNNLWFTEIQGNKIGRITPP